MRYLMWSRDLGSACEVCDSMTCEEALDVLASTLLGDDYYDVEIVNSDEEGRANAKIVEAILKKYARKKRIK